MNQSEIFDLDKIQPFIHPTAIVEDGAKIGANAYIGPNCFIGENVVIGSGSCLKFNVYVTGHTEIGSDNIIYPFASIGEEPQDMKYRGESTKLVIGDRNKIREGVSIHRGTVQGRGVTSIGNDNLIMVNVHIGHDCEIKNHCIISADSGLAGHVYVGDHAIIGGMCGIHQFCTIGAHVMLGGASGLVQDIPPFFLAQGNHATPHGINLVGIHRAGYSEECTSMIKKIYKLIYKSNLDYAMAVEKIRDLIAGRAEIEPFYIDFFAKSTRGVCR